jgi:hypothetical protein
MAVEYPHNCDRHNHHYWYPCTDCERERDAEIRDRERELELLEDIRWELQSRERADPPAPTRAARSPAKSATPAPPAEKSVFHDGGPLLRKHANVSPAAAWAGRNPHAPLISCFSNTRLAEGVMGKMLESHQQTISSWLGSSSKRPLVLTQRFAFLVGYATIGPDQHIPAYRVRLLLKLHPKGSGYQVWTGYPII